MCEHIELLGPRMMKVYVTQMLKTKYLNMDEVRQAQIYHKGEICAGVRTSFLTSFLNPKRGMFQIDSKSFSEIP